MTISREIFVSFVPFVLCTAVSGGAHAQATRLDTLSVGSARLATFPVRSDSSEYVVYAPDSASAARTRDVGHLSMQSFVFEVEHGTRYLFRVNHFASRTSNVTDSIMTALSGLAPIWETSHQTSKIMHLRWDGRHTAGDVTPTGKGMETIDQTAAVAPFNSSDGTLVIGALPLGPNYRALLATYEYEAGGLRLDTLAVVGREQITTGDGRAHDAWRVRVSRGGGSWMMVWLDAVTRDLLIQEFGSATKGWTIRIVKT